MTEPMSDQVEQRCGDGRGCAEVIDRLRAADLARGLGELDQADRLRQAASRWADAHGHGGAVALGEESAAS